MKPVTFPYHENGSLKKRSCSIIVARDSWYHHFGELPSEDSHMFPVSEWVPSSTKTVGALLSCCILIRHVWWGFSGVFETGDTARVRTTTVLLFCSYSFLFKWLTNISLAKSLSKDPFDGYIAKWKDLDAPFSHHYYGQRYFEMSEIIIGKIQQSVNDRIKTLKQGFPRH